MIAEDSITEQVREFFHQDHRVVGQQMVLLGESVYEYADHVEPFGDGEASDEVNGKVLPRLLWNGEWLENAVRSVASRQARQSGVRPILGVARDGTGFVGQSPGRTDAL